MPLKAAGTERIEISVKELEAIVERVRSHLSGEDHRMLKAAVETLEFLTQQLETKNVSLDRLRRLLFGSSSERTQKVLDDERTHEGTAARGSDEAESPSERPGAPTSAQSTSAEPSAEPGTSEKKKRPGHGRNGAGEYLGAEKVLVPHERLKPGGACPCDGCRGRVYRQSDPKRLVRVVGQGSMRVTVTELERLRCSLCGEVFTAKAPAGLGEEKYDATAASMVALLRYGTGVPFHRLEKLEGSLGIPLPAGTQWEIVKEAEEKVAPAYEELVREAAQGEVLHNDDTPMKVLELLSETRARAGPGEKERRADAEVDPVDPERTGVFTTGVISKCGDHQIALFSTGLRHAGENLARVLKERAPGLPPPVQMCDGLSRNVAEGFDVLLGNCLAHGRRKYVEVVESFPQECRFVLEILREVYRNDAEASELSAADRLRLHQEKSGPQMARLHGWLTAQLGEKKVEPNSTLGVAMKYMLKRWEKLTLFLRESGAPLDNNICERALKMAIRHRNNSLFYKTTRGARVGDIFMSLIHTVELCGANPFDYLTELQRNAERVRAAPSHWLPWNYQAALVAAANTS